MNKNWLYRAPSLGLSHKNITIVILLSLVATITEIFGIGIFLPIFQFIRLEGDISALVADSELWKYVIRIFGYIGIGTSLAALLLLSFGFFLTRQVFTYLRIVYNATVRQKVTQILRDRIFSKYIDANTSYHDNIPVGKLVNVITTEVNGAVMGIMAPMDLIVYCIMLLGYLTLLAILSWQMTLLSFIVLVVAGSIPSKWIKKSAYTGRKLVDANTQMSDFLIGRLRSPRLVRLSGTGIAEKNEFHELTQEQRQYSVIGSILQARTEVSMEPFVIGLSLVFLYFSYTVLHFKIEIIGLYLVIALRLLPIVKGIVLQWQTVQRFLGSIETIEGRLKEMTDSYEKDSGYEAIGQLKESYSFENVNYQYPATKVNVLKGITLKFKAGKITAIVGASGSGKSTLIDLLPRLRMPSSGSIKFDNVNIEKYSLKSLREIISYVPQSPQIFNGRVKAHILYGKKDATDEEILEAVRLADAEKFINQLPQGFDTILGDDAIKLSGGQRQRLDLARALISKASILVLDEPTSNLDAESAHMFKKTLAMINKNTRVTIIIVAHRLASISDADNIIVLNQGIVESSGSHLELLEKSEWYSNAWKVQSSLATNDY